MINRHLLPLALSLALPLAGTPPQGKKAAEAPHAAVDTAESCDRCHAEITPETHRLWYESRHGKLGVKCVVCHGSVGSGFRRKPTTERCAGCHDERRRGPRVQAARIQDLRGEGGESLTSRARGEGMRRLFPLVALLLAAPLAAQEKPAPAPTPAPKTFDFGAQIRLRGDSVNNLDLSEEKDNRDAYVLSRVRLWGSFRRGEKLSSGAPSTAASCA